MQIACPKCSTSYQIAETAVGSGGRPARCARCQNVWRVEPAETAKAEAPAAAETMAFAAELGSAPPAADPAPAEQPPAEPADPETAATAEEMPPALSPEATVEPEPAADVAPAPPAAEELVTEPAQVALSDIPLPIENAPPLQPEPGEGALPPVGHVAIDNAPADIESVAARHEAAVRRQRWRKMPLPAVIFMMALACLAMFVMRKDIVRHFPQMASFYASFGMPVNLRGLEFNDLKISNETHDGVPVLVVEGTIVSKASMPVDVPRLRFALRNAAGAEVYTWTALPTQNVLEPGQTLPFRSRLASPPAEGHDVQVRFFNRRDAASGLH
jgi:predicted Zn finger-like uncharacterized protein